MAAGAGEHLLRMHRLATVAPGDDLVGANQRQVGGVQLAQARIRQVDDLQLQAQAPRSVQQLVPGRRLP